MVLNEKSKEEIRKVIERELEDYNGEERIHLDKDLLESLMFKDITTIVDNTERKMRRIVWSGQFLRKIDLSEVSFDNVHWNYENHDANCKYIVDLSGTNATIDFSKSFDNIYCPKSGVVINSCNLSETDLLNGEVITKIYNSDLSNSSLNLGTGERGNLRIFNSNLNGVNLSNLTVPMETFLDYESWVYIRAGFQVRSVCLKNTGLNIRYDINIPSGILTEYKKIINPKRKFVEASHDLEKYCKECRQGYILGQLIKEGLLEGCYVNGILIKSKLQRFNIKNKALIEYEQMQQNIIDKVKSQIRQYRK